MHEFVAGWQADVLNSSKRCLHVHLREGVHPVRARWHFTASARHTPACLLCQFVPSLSICVVYRSRRLLGCSCSSPQPGGAQTMESWWPGLGLKGVTAMLLTDISQCVEIGIDVK